MQELVRSAEFLPLVTKASGRFFFFSRTHFFFFLLIHTTQQMTFGVAFLSLQLQKPDRNIHFGAIFTSVTLCNLKPSGKDY